MIRRSVLTCKFPGSPQKGVYYRAFSKLKRNLHKASAPLTDTGVGCQTSSPTQLGVSRNSVGGENWAAEQKASAVTAPRPKCKLLQNIVPGLQDSGVYCRDKLL